MVAKTCPQARLLVSSQRMGPGGSRNLLTRAASHPWVAHFDDDSQPSKVSFFADAARWLTHLPASVAVLAGTIVTHEPPAEAGSVKLVAFYPGCGHLMNRSWFLRTQGYQVRPIAYNFEEVDVSLQLYRLGAHVIQVADLEIDHFHPTPALDFWEVEAGVLANLCLFPVLRYSAILLPWAAFRALRRMMVRILPRPERGIILRQAAADLRHSLPLVWARRHPVPAVVCLNWMHLRRQPVPANLSASF